MRPEIIIHQPSCADDVDKDSLRVDEARQRILTAVTPITDRLTQCVGTNSGTGYCLATERARAHQLSDGRHCRYEQ